MEGETISSESRTSFDTVTILVVDDDITCLAIVAALLKKFKYEVVTVKHPSDALCTLRVKGGAFDLVVSDIHMPDMNGFELQQAISQEFHLPVVLMSADKKEGVISKGLENGAAFFISKPVSPDDLRNLWQFAATKKRSSQVVIKEIVGSNDLLPQGITSDDKENSNGKPVVVAASTSSNRGCRSTKNSKRKTPRKEGSDDDEERGNNDSHNAAASNKKPKVIWTNALHNRFLEAIRSIGLDRCVPKKILEVMDVPGLTRENVASHLQKYRIFLRRVSDASSLIHGVDDKGSLSRGTLSRFSKFQYHQNPGNFPGGLNKMAQPRFAQSQLCSSNVSLSEPNILRTNMIGPNDRPGDGITQQNNYETSQLFQGNLSNDVLSACFDASNLASTWETQSIITPDDQVFAQNNGISSIPSTSFPDQTNYVGYEISNIKHLAESRSNDELQNNSFIIHNGASDLPNDDNNINLEQLMVIVNDGEQLSDVVNSTLHHRHHQNLPMPPLDHHDPPNFLGNEGTINEGQINDLSSEFSHIYHVPEFDVTNQLLQPLVVEDDQVNIQKQLTQMNGGEKITSSSLLYGGTNNHWDNHVSSYDQAPDQRDDDDFLASLLGTFGDDQPFDGI